MKEKNGFTLIELLAVIAILGLLVTIAGFSVTSILKKSKKDVNDIQASKMIDAAKLMVMDKPDVFTGYDPSISISGVDCSDRSQMYKCVIDKDGFKGYLDKTDNITGCVIVEYQYPLNGLEEGFTYSYGSNELDCDNSNS